MDAEKRLISKCYNLEKTLVETVSSWLPGEILATVGKTVHFRLWAAGQVELAKLILSHNHPDIVAVEKALKELPFWKGD